MSATTREPLDVRTVPSGDSIRRADAAMAASDRRECPFCYAPIDEEGFCSDKECR